MVGNRAWYIEITAIKMGIIVSKIEECNSSNTQYVDRGQEYKKG